MKYRQRKEIQMQQDIREELKQIDPKEYTSIPFWSWNNRMEEKHLIKQIHEMKQAGMRGFMIHARNGLEVEYLSEEWFALVEKCLEEAKRQEMRVLIYDEHGWPSGFAGGKLLEIPENRARYLAYEKKEQFDPDAFAVYVADDPCQKIRRIEEPEKGQKEYHCIYLKSSPANTDILNPDVVEQFIQMTYEAYWRHFKDRFGKELAGFFTDEPQYYRYATPYTPVAEKIWQERFGEDIRDGLLYLFLTDEAGYPYRTRYYRLMNELYTTNYYKKIYDWCTAHHCLFTGHSIEENNLCRQMWGGAAVTPTYEYETIPAIDHLGKVPSASLSARQVGSAAAQLGKKRVLTESFCGAGWDCTPAELKQIAESQYVRGVNMMCQHLVSYSLKGQGKQDYPPSFGSQNTWKDGYPVFNQYFDSLGYLLINSKEMTNAVVINPMGSVYLNYIRLEEEHVRELDDNMQELIRTLDSSGISWHLVDETILSKHGKAENGKLTVGECQYQHIILPDCLSLFSDTKRLLEQLDRQGGNLYLAGRAPSYTEGKTDKYLFLDKKLKDHLQEIRKTETIQLEIEGQIPFTYRDRGSYQFLYLLNEGRERGSCVLPDTSFLRLDLNTLEIERAERHLILKPGESAILLKNYQLQDEIPEKPAYHYSQIQDMTDAFQFEKADPNGLPIDLACISKDGIHFEKPHPVWEICERLMREVYEGELWVKHLFEVDGYTGKMNLMLEDSRQKELALNGERLYPKTGNFDPLFLQCDITDKIREGENELCYQLYWHQDNRVRTALFDPESTESLSNCLTFDSEIEPVYLLGDFEVDEKRRIRKPEKKISIRDITGSGYPYFAGKITLVAKVFARQKKAKIVVEGNYMIYHVKINGKDAGQSVFSESVPVELMPGKENGIELTLTSSMRNLLGPHHLKQETDCVSQDCFTMRGTWKNGESPQYQEEYRTVRFGVEHVWLKYEE